MSGASRSHERDRLASSVAAERARAGNPAGSALVLGDGSGVLARALEGRGTRVVEWHRSFVDGREPDEPWPPPGPFEQVWLRIPRSGLETRMLLTAAAARTASGGTVLAYGAKDEGIRSVDNHRPAVLTPFETVRIKRRCRVSIARVREAGEDDAAREQVPPDGLEAWAERWTLDLGTGPREWVSFPGVFAHGRLDPATQLLLGHLPSLPPGARVLDFGAGTGVIGAAVLERVPDARVDLLDPDGIALAAAAVNVPDARPIRAADLDAAGADYDLIASNPPVHEGKRETLSVVAHLARGSAGRIARSGRLMLVIQRRMAVEPLLRAAFARVEAVADEGAFRVWSARP